jgi:hypothetical protein
LKLLNPVAELHDMCEIFNDSGGGFSKEIHGRNE